MVVQVNIFHIHHWSNIDYIVITIDEMGTNCGFCIVIKGRGFAHGLIRDR